MLIVEDCVEKCSLIYVQEGKQASLAADFSITQFKHIGRLLVWHGRNRSDFTLQCVIYVYVCLSLWMLNSCVLLPVISYECLLQL